MKPILRYLFAALLTFVTLAFTFLHEVHAQSISETNVPASIYGDFGGAFVLYDQNADHFTEYHPKECERVLSPASTFKIPNSLIGLESGVIKDEHYVIPWDSVTRDFPAWNRDHDLASAIANSVVWYYQELARRVGEDRMRKYVQAIGYGNNDISGGIDRFWLGSTLKISALQQVAFLRRLHDETLPFSHKSMEIVKRILVLEQTDSTVLRGKTGFAIQQDGTVVGWLVGYVEKRGNVYYFACNFTSENEKRDGNAIFARKKDMAIEVLRKLGVL
jgi:beta-lactamase class D